MTDDGQYKKVSLWVDQWLKLHEGERFDLDRVCRDMRAVTREGRQYVAQKLSYEVKQERLDKRDRIYRMVDKSCKFIQWVNAPDQAFIDLVWPYDHENTDTFGFDGKVLISPGDIIVIAGVSNMGKTAFCLNLLWDNMDKYACTLMGNEYAPAKFKNRASRMKWANPLWDTGEAKFELIERYEAWEDIIRPDNINIIDWITVGDNFYRVGKVIEGIKAKLNGGIAIIALQKNSGKELGEGGEFSERLSSVYLTLDFERLHVRKAKAWNGSNPNNKDYGFSIIEGGTQFHNIREISKCKACWGRGMVHGGTCENCAGKGFVDV